MQPSIKETIRTRRSVRTFDGRALSAEDNTALEAYLAPLQNPFGVPVTFRLMNAKENNLSSPVIIGEQAYLAAKVARVTNYEIAFGYSFEKACLYAWSRGVGTVMLAASLSRSAFETAMAVQPDEVLPVASPVGYPAEKKSVRERLMRKGLKADERKAFDTLFFRQFFDTPLQKADAGDFFDALEALRLAPSATNGQPWRVILDGDTVHFYEAKTMRDNALGDIQKVDIGIALAHFDLVCEEDGIKGSFVFADPGLAAPENTRYIVSFRRER